MPAAKVLVGMYQPRHLLGDAGADAVELAGFGFVPAMMNRHPLAVTQQNHLAALAEHGIEAVDLLLSLNQDILQRVAIARLATIPSGSNATSAAY
jgi:hypothetical protein